MIEAQGIILSKQAIIAALGDRALTLPGLIGEALAANDRVKYRLTLLQVARHHADAPQAPVPGLRAERVTARIDDASLDALPAECTRDAAANYRLPGVEAVHEEDGRVVLSVREPHETIPALLAAIQGRNGHLLHLTTRQASLEDVFVHLTGRHLREE